MASMKASEQQLRKSPDHANTQPIKEMSPPLEQSPEMSSSPVGNRGSGFRRNDNFAVDMEAFGVL